ncbi:MAG: L-histidine N(alpha)-methyltransferase [Rhizomicrobium sp.]
MSAAAINPKTRDCAFRDALLEGLFGTPKSIPAKFFYDEVGSALFERITTLKEYYPTRTELAILTGNVREIAALIGPDAELVEFGAGSLRKVRILLDALKSPRAYLPIDISGDYLMDVAATLRDDYPGLRVRPVIADFTRAVALGPLTGGARHRAGFFPGSTIGNLGRAEAVAFLRQARQTLNGGGLLIGVDLVKDPAILHAAYNDAEGVTEAFNKNLLFRANREADSAFDPGRFAHYACYNPREQRVEMYLVSLAEQRVRVAGEIASFAEGEAIHTEDSQKYTLDGFRALAAEAGYIQRRVWTDPARLFSVQWLEAA